MNELKVVVNQQNGVVDFNYEEIKTALADQMKVYSSLVFTEDKKADAKKDVANLRKLKTAIDSKRKEVKKSYMKPYENFENKIKELITLVDEPIKMIDTQVKDFEEKQRKEKQQKIKDAFKEEIGDIGYITLESIYKKEWENVSTSIKSIKADMSERIFNIKNDLNTLDAFGSDAGTKAKQTYLENGYNLAPCVQYIQQYEQQKKEIEERRAEEEKRKAEQQKIEEEKRLAEQQKIEEEQSKKAEQPAEVEKPAETGFSFFEQPKGFSFFEQPMQTVTFTVTATADHIDMIRNYINSLNVDYKEN